MKKTSLRILVVSILIISMVAPITEAAAGRVGNCLSKMCDIFNIKVTYAPSIEISGYHYNIWITYNPHLYYNCTMPMSLYRCSKSSKVEERASTCTEDGLITWHCAICDSDFTESINMIGHSFTNYIPDENNGSRTAICDRQGCGVTDTIIYGVSEPMHTFERDISRDKSPTCTEAGIEAYSCSQSGCAARADQEISALGHDYVVSRSDPTCTDTGMVTFSCSRCAASETIESAPRHGHWYEEWTANDDGTHSADCRRGRCSHTATTECASFTSILNGSKITLCPICGEISTAERLLLDETASAKATTKSLPRGELALRRGSLSDGTEIMVASFEYAGKLEQPKGVVRISLPSDVLNGYTLHLHDSNDKDTEISYSVTDGMLSFNLDFTSLASTESVPVALIHLIPEK